MTFEDLLNDEPYKSCYEKGLADGEAKGRADAIDECKNLITSMRLDNISSNGTNILDALEQLKGDCIKANKMEYRIVGRFVKDEKSHVVDHNLKWTLQDAQRRLEELKREVEVAKKRGEHVSNCGGIGISTPFYSEYELVDLRIQSREVTPWSNMD